MRICSLLPGATEIVFALGLGDQITGVTHECDYPPQAKDKTVVVNSSIDPKRMTSGEIDRKVGAILQGGNNLYTIDHEALIESAPDLILTQSLCDVCAIDYNEVLRAANSLASKPAVISLNPHSLADVFDDILRIGAATQRLLVAQALVRDLQSRVDRIAEPAPGKRPRVVCLEWFEPLYVAGHWVPEIVGLAGADDVLARAGEPSRRVEWKDIVAAEPDVILLMPCGFDVRRAAREATPLRSLPGWNDLPAVKTSNVFALNGSAYFSRPGPRLVNGLEILAQLIHPGRASQNPSPGDAVTLN
jgi:iron complex transport system substrate-binding protein